MNENHLTDICDDSQNPLDVIEELYQSYEWNFDRKSANDLYVQISGRYDAYDFSIAWDEDHRCLHFMGQYGFAIPKDGYPRLYQMLSQMNEHLWLGHFILHAHSGLPTWRYTKFCPNPYQPGTVDEYEDMIDIAVKQMEQYQPAFEWASMVKADDELRNNHYKIAGEDNDNSPLDLILMQTAGQS